jgi:hypothetical protein
MEALPMDGTEYDTPPQTEFIPNDEVYLGYFDVPTLHKLESLGVLVVIGEYDDERQAVKLCERDDFLASWQAGASEARNGSDLHYADYSNNQFAFSAGYEHWQHRQKQSAKRGFNHYSSSLEFVCHGFLDGDTDELHRQY